jgi:DNA-binding response OmpR family regulator
MPRRKKILVIDDEEDFSFFTRKNLQRSNYEVIIAASGEDGLRIAQTSQPDVILLDIMMPGMNGFEVLHKLKEDPLTNTIPVVMLTGKDDETSHQQAAQLKNADYIVKPVEIEELHKRIEQALKP